MTVTVRCCPPLALACSFLLNLLIMVSVANATCPGSQDLPTFARIGYYPAVRIDSLQRPIVASYNLDEEALAIQACDDYYCTSYQYNGNVTSMKTQIQRIALRIHQDKPSIVFSEGVLPNTALSFLRCNDRACLTSIRVTLDNTTSTQLANWYSLVLTATGFPLVAYHDLADDSLLFVRCSSTICSAVSVSAPKVLDPSGGRWCDIQLTPIGARPIVAYIDEFANVKLAECNDPACTTLVLRVVDDGNNAGSTTLLRFRGATQPFVSFLTAVTKSLVGVFCTTMNCTDSLRTRVAVTPPDGSLLSSRTIDSEITSGGNPVFTYLNDTLDEVHLVRCNDLDCSNNTVILSEGYSLDTTIGTDDGIVMVYRPFVVQAGFRINRECSGTQMPTSATTTTPSPTSAPTFLVTLPPSVSPSTIISGTITVNSAIDISQGSLVVNGSVTFTPSATLTISEGLQTPFINVSDTATLAGTLEVILQQKPEAVVPVVVPVLQAQQTVGAFDAINATLAQPSQLLACEHLTGVEQRDNRGGVSVAISLDRAGCRSATLHPGVIAGIALGCVLVAVLLVLLMVFAHRRRVSRLTTEGNNRIKNSELAEIRRQKSRS